MSLSNFTADSLEGFLISSSMVGLTLVIAVYSITMPRIKEILNRQIKKLRALLTQRDDVLEKLRKDKDNESLASQFRKLQKDIKLAKKLPYHLDLGYQISAVGFVGSLIVPLLTLMFPDSSLIKQIAQGSVIYFVLGVLSFIVVWFLVFVEFRNYVTEEFQKNMEDLDKESKDDGIAQAIESALKNQPIWENHTWMSRRKKKG